MRSVNVQALSGNANTTKNGNLIDANQLVSASFHLFFSAADATGTFKLQASDDVTPLGYQATGAGFAPTNWVDLPSQTCTITAGLPAILSIPNCTYRWLRAVWTSTNVAATGTVTVNLNALGM